MIRSMDAVRVVKDQVISIDAERKRERRTT
jgi:hypothetical protein